MSQNSISQTTTQVDCRRWTDRWLTVRGAGSGSQGTGKVVRLKACPTGPDYFIKLLNHNGDHERRARFYREASALDSYSHRGIPTLIETNAAYHRDDAYRLYLVTEFVPGPTLEEAVNDKGPLELGAAMAMVSGLLAIIGYLHDQSAGHRDIKPANVILRDAHPGDPVLVDFGLVHMVETSAAHATEDGQEIGNRFLRLPELAPGSATKRNPRSDITFVGGLLLYTLTGKTPSVLEDEAGRLPHQRKGVRELLDTIPAHQQYPLLRFFDKVFNPRIAERFVTAADALTALNLVKDAKPDSDPDEVKVILERLRAEGESMTTERLTRYRKAISAAEGAIIQIRDEIVEAVGGRFYRTDGDSRRLRPTLYSVKIGISSAFSDAERFLPRFHIEIVGDEVVVSLGDDQNPAYRSELGRAEINEPAFDSSFTERVRLLYARSLEKLSSLPENQPPLL
jgi:serine/threonine protein kinase